MLANDLLQGLRRPVLAELDLQPLALLELPQRLPHLHQHGHGCERGFRVVEEALAADVADEHFHPAPQLPPSGHDHQQPEHHGPHPEDGQQKIARRALPPVVDSEVIHHARLSDRRSEQIGEGKDGRHAGEAVRDDATVLHPASRRNPTRSAYARSVR